MYDLAQKVIELRLATRRACMCESKGKLRKNTLSLKTKVLFLVEKNYSPKEIIAELEIAKTNLALITNALAEDGSIIKKRGTVDRREVAYIITDKGRETLAERLAAIEANACASLPREDCYKEAAAALDRALAVLYGNAFD